MLGREADSDRDGGCPDLADLCATQPWRLVRIQDAATNAPGPAENLASFMVGPLAPGQSGSVELSKPGGYFYNDRAGFRWNTAEIVVS